MRLDGDDSHLEIDEKVLDGVMWIDESERLGVIEMRLDGVLHRQASCGGS